MEINFILLILIAVNVLVSLKGFDNISFFRKNEFHIGSIRAGEQMRMLTSAFLHVDVMHLLFNMLALFFFAPYVYTYFNNFTFILIYLGSLIFGSLLTLIIHKNDQSYRAVGASGAVTGIIYSAILLDPSMTIYVFFIPMKGYVFAILYLVYSIYGMKTKNDNIGHTAHFGGAIGGFLLTLVKEPQIITEHTSLVLFLAIPIVVLFFLARSGKI